MWFRGDRVEILRGPDKGKQGYINCIVQERNWVTVEEDWMWFRGDRVEILKGPDKGKQGYINGIVQERNWVTVEGLNVEYETMGATKDFPGMMVKKELPLIVTRDIQLVDPVNEKP